MLVKQSYKPPRNINNDATPVILNYTAASNTTRFCWLTKPLLQTLAGYCITPTPNQAPAASFLHNAPVVL